MNTEAFVENNASDSVERNTIAVIHVVCIESKRIQNRKPTDSFLSDAIGNITSNDILTVRIT